ncbi:MAG: CopG family ribbon-helix-helix protein [Promethearchaeota archaeon]
MEDKEYERFTISLPRKLFKEFETFRKKINLSRSESIRKAMSIYMANVERASEFSGNVVGCITMIYRHEHFPVQDDHVHNYSKNDFSPGNNSESKKILQNNDRHVHDYSKGSIYADIFQTDLIKKNDIAHHFTDIIISTMHVHLSFDKCLEIIAVRGPIERVKKYKNALEQLKSVISVQFQIIEQQI